VSNKEQDVYFPDTWAHVVKVLKMSVIDCSQYFKKCSPWFIVSLIKSSTVKINDSKGLIIVHACRSIQHHVPLTSVLHDKNQQPKGKIIFHVG